MLKRIFFALIVLVGLVLQEAEGQAARPPNIVIFFADDLGYGDLSSYGHPTIRTPHLDRMAEEGIRLTSFYAAAPGCSPSRASLLTGRYPVRAGMPNVIGPNSEKGLPLSEVTIAEALKARGYRTFAVGKWHLGDAPAFNPIHQDFDDYYGLLYSNDMIRPWVQTDKPLRLHRGTKPVEEHPLDQTTLTQRYTREAVRFIEEAGQEPFFLYVAHSMPHLPVYASEAFRGRSRGGLYGDVIEEIDWSVGEVLRTLKARGLDEETLVLFTSDNGPWQNLPDRMLQEGIRPWHVGSAGHLRGSKATTYEGGMRVPFIARWPGRIEAGRESAELVTTLDLFPTLVKLAGGTLPQDRVLDGGDVWAFLQGRQERSPRQEFYYFQRERLDAVREGKWKLRIANSSHDGTPRDGSPELFDLDTDPSERYNVASEHPDVVERLRAKMRAMEANVRASP